MQYLLFVCVHIYIAFMIMTYLVYDTLQEMCKKCHHPYIMDVCIVWSTYQCCVQEICLKHRMYMKCYLSCVPYTLNIYLMPPIQCIGNVCEVSCVLWLKYHVYWAQEMWMKYVPCILATRNVSEIVPYTVSGNVQEVYKYLVLRNVHSMNKKCDQFYTFLGDFHT